MDPARWRRLEAVFDEAVLEPTGRGRDTLVRSRCEGDESLAAEVLALLREDDRLTSAEAPPDPHIGTMPKDDWRIASAWSILGGHLVLAKCFPEAETTLVAAERELTAALGNESAVVADARQRLVDLYAAWERPADAERWRGRLPRESQ